jgi:bacterioferritin-associated ferredoxin
MIVCCCHAVRDRDYLAACRKALAEQRYVEEFNPAGTCCGGCLGTLQELRTQIEAEAGAGSIPSRCALALLPGALHKTSLANPEEGPPEARAFHPCEIPREPDRKS